jgi:hypothetical protein
MGFIDDWDAGTPTPPPGNPQLPDDTPPDWEPEAPAPTPGRPPTPAPRPAPPEVVSTSLGQGFAADIRRSKEGAALGADYLMSMAEAKGVRQEQIQEIRASLTQGQQALMYADETGSFVSFEEDPDSHTNAARLLQVTWEVATNQWNEDEDLQKWVKRQVHMLSDIMPAEVFDEYSLDRIPEPDKAEIFGSEWLGGAGQVAKGLAFGDHFIGNLLTEVLVNLDTMSQGILTGAKAWNRGDFLGAARRGGEGLTFGQFGRGGIDQELEISDVDGDGVLNFREALGIDPEWGGRWAGALDTFAIAATDPISYAGVGVAAKLKAGLEAVFINFGDDAMRQVFRQGAKALTTAEWRVVEGTIRQRIREAGESGARQGTRIQRRRFTVDQLQEKLGDKQLKQLQTRSGTFRMGGQNIRIPGMGALGELADKSKILRTINPTRRLSGLSRISKGGRELMEGSDDAARAVFGAGARNTTSTTAGVRVDGDILASKALKNPDGSLLADQGQRIGTFGRRIETRGDDVVAFFDSSVIDEPFQRQGQATTFLKKQVDALEDMGVDRIHLEAGGDAAVVAARQGFEYDVASQGFEAWANGVRVALRGRSDDAADQLADQFDEAIRTKNWGLLPDMRFDEGLQAIRGVIDEFGQIPLVRVIDADKHIRSVGVSRGGAQALRETSERTLQPSASTRGQRAVTRSAKALRTPGRLLDAITPRAGIRNALGRRMETLVDGIRTKTGANAEQMLQDMVSALDQPYRMAARESGSFSEASRIGREAMEVRPPPGTISPEVVIERMAQAQDVAGNPAMAAWVRAVGDARVSIEMSARRAGLPEEFLNEAYFPRATSKEGREAIKQNVALASDVNGPLRAGLDGVEAGFQQPRQKMPKKTVTEVNAQLAKDYGLGEGFQVFTEDTFTALVTRGRAAFGAAAHHDMLVEMSELFATQSRRGMSVLDSGSSREALVIQAEKGVKQPQGYTKITTQNGTFFADPVIVDEITKVKRWLTDDKSLQGMEDFLENWSRTWGSNATAPLLDGLGFHSRNATGNVMLNMLAGVVNPARYTEAAVYQRQMDRAFRTMKSDGVSFEQALKGTRLDARQQQVALGLRENDIIGSGFMDDLAAGGASTSQYRDGAVSGPGVIREKVVPKYEGGWDFAQNNPVVSTGRALGSMVEKNARIAHYITKLDAKGGTAESAARSVRTYLFDYTDLTGIERSLRKISRFYTFMRKNTAVQLWALTHNPGRVLAIERGFQGKSPAGAIGSALGVRKDYSAERGDSWNLGDGLTGGIESPLSAAADTLRPVGEIISLMSGGGTLDDLIESVLGLTAGSAPAFIEFAYSQKSDYNFFLDRPLSDDEIKSKESMFQRLADATIGPLWSSMDRFASRLTDGNLEGTGGILGLGIGNNPSTATKEKGIEMAFWSSVLGLNVASTSTQDEAKEQWVRDLSFELRDEILPDLRDKYGDEAIPTWELLVSTGTVAGTPGSPRRAESEVSAERIEAAEAANLDSALLQEELDERQASEAERGVVIDEETGEYTTRDARVKELSSALGVYVLDDDGNPKLDDDGNPKPAINWYVKEQWNEQNRDDQIETSRTDTVSALSNSLGISVVRDGEIAIDAATGLPVPSINAMAKASYNLTNPDDPYLNADGSEVTYRNVSVVWDLATAADVLDWLRGKGVEVPAHTDSTTKAMREAYNREHPSRPVLTTRQKVERGYRPIQGVFKLIVDGDLVREIWPEGMSEGNWEVTPTSALLD